MCVSFYFIPGKAETLKLEDEMAGEEKPKNRVWAKVKRASGLQFCGLWADYCPQGNCESCVVKYLVDEEREARKLTWSEKHKVWLDRNAKPYDTATENKKHPIEKHTLCDLAAKKTWGISPGIWVVDTLGNFYTSVEQTPGVFHHSSFMAGGLVRAAGQVVFVDGKIIGINNSSGHYKPDQKSFDIVVKGLHVENPKDAIYDVSSSARRSLTNIRESAPARPPTAKPEKTLVQPEPSLELYARQPDQYEFGDCYKTYEDGDGVNSNN